MSRGHSATPLWGGILKIDQILSMLYVRLMIKVKVGKPESLKVGWYPHKTTGSSHLNSFALKVRNPDAIFT